MPTRNEEKILHSSYEIALKALSALHKEELGDLHKIRSVKIHQHELIEKFEESFDSFLNYVKEYLWMVNGIEQSTPKAILRELVTVQVINEEELAILSHMIDHRNKISHGHTQDDIVKFAYALPVYDKVISKVLLALKPIEA